MFGLVAIAILGMCFTIDILSGDRSRAGGAWVLLSIIIIYCVVICLKDTEEKHKEKMKEIEYNISVLRKRYPGRDMRWYQKIARKYPGFMIEGADFSNEK